MRFGFGLATVLTLVLATKALAAGTIGVELNTLTQANTTCRLVIVVRNNMGVALSELGLDVVFFDKDGRFDRSTLLRTGSSLPPGKSRVGQYELENLNCMSVGRILVNDVVECGGVGLTPAICLEALTLSTKAGIPLEF